MNKQILQKIQSGASLSREEQIEFELALEDSNRSQVREWVQGLPDEMPSLAWRSGLNEALQNLSQVQRPKRRLRWAWISASAMSLVGAGALLFVLVRPHAEPSTDPSSSIEAAIVASHMESVSALESGAPLTLRPTAAASRQSTSWNEADIEAL